MIIKVGYLRSGRWWLWIWIYRRLHICVSEGMKCGDTVIAVAGGDVLHCDAYGIRNDNYRSLCFQIHSVAFRSAIQFKNVSLGRT